MIGTVCLIYKNNIVSFLLITSSYLGTNESIHVLRGVCDVLVERWCRQLGILQSRLTISRKLENMQRKGDSTSIAQLGKSRTLCNFPKNFTSGRWCLSRNNKVSCNGAPSAPWFFVLKWIIRVQNRDESFERKKKKYWHFNYGPTADVRERLRCFHHGNGAHIMFVVGFYAYVDRLLNHIKILLEFQLMYSQFFSCFVARLLPFNQLVELLKNLKSWCWVHNARFNMVTKWEHTANKQSSPKIITFKHPLSAIFELYTNFHWEA